MVYISKVEIRNFKSFEGSTTVEFVKGFNAITGRNGSGKSNIIDAIRFALGENSVKAMRESRMSALINDRGRGRAARVSIYLVNEGDAPFKEPQLVITRELLQSGEQRYYINGRRTTRNNVVDLLYSMGISADGLNIVPQGAIARIAEMNPSERREMLEDLVGLKVYDEKREEAMNRLREADSILAATFAKLDEKRETMNMLEEEMNILFRYEVLQSDLARVKKTRLLVMAEELEREAEEASREAREAEEELETISRELDEVSRAEAEPGYRAELISKYASTKAEYESLKMTIEGLASERDRLSEELRKLEDAMRSLKSMEEGLLRELERSKEEARGAQERLNAARERERAADEEVRALRERLEGERREEASRRERAMRLARALERIREARRRAEGELLRLRPSVEIASGIEKEYGEILRKNEEVIERLRAALSEGAEAVRGEVQRLKELISKYERLKEKRRREREVLAEAVSVLSRALGYIQAQRESGGYREAGLEGLLRLGVIRGYLGRLSELVEAEGGYEGPVRAAISWLGNPFIFERPLSDEELEALKGVPRIRVAWPTLGGGEPATCSIFWHVKVKDRRAEQAVKELLSGICVEACGGCEALVGRDLRVVGGSVAEVGVIMGQAEAGDLARLVGRLEEQLRKRAEELEAYSKLIEKIRGEVSRSKARTLAASGALRPIFELLKSEEALVDSLKKRAKEGALKLEEERRMAEAAEKALNALYSKEEELEGLLLRLLSESADAALSERLRSAEEELEAARRERAEAEDAASRSHRSVEELEGKLGSLRSSFEDVSSRAQGLRAELKRAEEEINAAKKRLEELERELSELEGRVSMIGGVNQDEVRAKKEALMKRVRELERKAERLRLTSQSRSEEAARLREEASKIELEPLGWTEGLEELEKGLADEISEIYQRVNRMAYSDYRLFYESYRDAAAKRSELEKDREAIVRFIEEIDREKTQTFMSAFERIDRAFRDIFSKLVDGSAWLELEDPKDPFKGGVFMLAKFGEKKEREASSLSGGEKAITSVAFLLALQAAYKSHFYIFDEIDANLDAERSRRLGEFLREWGRENQIILISLKDTVISRADRILGVYERGGASHVLELRAEELERGR